MAFRPAVLNSHTLPLGITGFLQTLAKRDYHRCVSLRRRTVEKSDHRHSRLLRPRRQRPSGRAAEKRDERAALHSITSSARAESARGTSSPSALAVFRLSTNSNLVDWTIGRSAGFSPFQIRPVY